jgi:hypothetical protein
MKKIIAIALLLSPSLTFAQVTGPVNTVDDIFTKFTVLGNSFVTILISLSVVWIIFNVVRYLIAGSEEDRKKGGMSILYGVIALFVILSVWGLVYILKRTFSTGENRVQDPKDVPRILPVQ